MGIVSIEEFMKNVEDKYNFKVFKEAARKAEIISFFENELGIEHIDRSKQPKRLQLVLLK